MRFALRPLAATAVLGTALLALAACGSEKGGGTTEPADLCPANATATEPNRISLAVGQSAQLLDAAASKCVLLSGGSRYVITVGNTNPTPTTTVAYQLAGAAGSTSASVAPSADAAPFAAPTAAQLFGGPDATELARSRRVLAAHGRMLELNRTIVRGMPSPRDAWSAERARRRERGVSLATAPSLAVGSVTEVRILNRDDPGGNLCSNVNHIPIRARTVYVGTRSIVLEDSLSPLAGQMDTTFIRLAQEFDATMFPILQDYFGNPLAMDPELDNNGRIIMVFSPKINDFGDIAGFVLNCDFFPRADSPVSNAGEYFYAIVPDSLGGGIRNWDRGIRGTLIHEVKHITSNAERFSRNAPALEESWLEEGTAVHSEEIWARTQFGNTWKGNATYATTLFCEVRPTSTVNPQCRGKPFVMFGTYATLYDYLEANEKYTPLGRVEDGDFVFYSASWSLVRWAADQYATTEQAFFKALTQSTTSGLTNLTARTGHPWPEMLADWSLALATDDRPGFTPARAQLTIPSWNTRDIFAGMNQDFPDASGFPRPFPLVARAVSFGAFVQSVPSLRSGSFSAFELSGSSAASQVIELRGAGGTIDAPAGLVMHILRIQ